MISFLDYSLFSQIIPAFLLIFVLSYAVLQKSKLLDAKPQTDALISLAISLLFIITPFARKFVVEIMPFLAIALAVMLVFLILYGFVAGESGIKDKGWLKTVFGILAGIFLLAVVIYVSGFWKNMNNYLFGMFGASFWAGILLIVLVAAAVVFVMKGGKWGK